MTSRCLNRNHLHAAKYDETGNGGKKYSWMIGRRIAVLSVLVMILLTGLLCMDHSKVSADTYDNAYSYYQKYGNRIVFVPITTTDGNIYYATKAKRTTSNILFSNIGWKARVTDPKGATLQEIYYKMDGNYLKTTDIRTAGDGYEYALYSLSLKDFKSRLNAPTLKALEEGDCKVIFDACIIIKKNGITGGGMTDKGISWGKVYTTYDSIINAEQWSTVTQNSLSTYYQKEIENLFYHVTVVRDGGISYVTGGGNYCYGTAIHLYAVPKENYAFFQWSGDITSFEAKTCITVTKNLFYMANSVPKNLEITYYRNRDLKDAETAKQICVYGEQEQTLQNWGWTKTGYYQTGWKYNRLGPGADYSTREEVTSNWIMAKLPAISLYGNWSPNRYTICFDPNGAYEDWEPDNWDYPQMQTRDVNYESTFTLPQCEFKNKKAAFLGWGLKADDNTPLFDPYQTVAVRNFVWQLGIENSDGATITLYAIWDNMPAIDAANIYVSIHNARAGKVTEEYIASYASASDKEDGNLSYGVNENHTFLLKDYNEEVYLNAEKEGYVKETFVVIDSSGNRIERTIKVYLIDTKIYTEAEIDGTLRFISPDYFKGGDGKLLPEEEGGLKEESVWRRDEEYLDLLNQAFDKFRFVGE